ncbi:MAG: ferritin family protein [Thermodesulfobacteriota bacterium]|nr:ferritin family protein [Thermodesulfobacteriota bacterium]
MNIKNDSTLDNVMQAIKSAIILEIKGEQFYKTAAEKTSNKKIRDLFLYFAEQEVLHRKFLEMNYDELLKSDNWIPDELKPEPSFDIADNVINEELKNSLKHTWFEASAISIAMNLELEALNFYQEAAKKTNNPNAKKLYESLAVWENKHFDKFNTLEASLREEFWEAVRFSPS